MKAYVARSQMYNPTELTNNENRTEVIDATASVGIDKKNSESLYYLLCLTCRELHRQFSDVHLLETVQRRGDNNTSVMGRKT